MADFEQEIKVLLSMDSSKFLKDLEQSRTATDKLKDTLVNMIKKSVEATTAMNGMAERPTKVWQVIKTELDANIKLLTDYERALKRIKAEESKAYDASGGSYIKKSDIKIRQEAIASVGGDDEKTKLQLAQMIQSIRRLKVY